MSIVVMFLWLLGLTFFVILWIGVAASIFRVVREMVSLDTWSRGGDRREHSRSRGVQLRPGVSAPHV